MMKNRVLTVRAAKASTLAAVVMSIGMALTLAAPVTFSQEGDNDTARCQQTCSNQRRSCLVGTNYTDCPGTGLFGDPQKGAHDQCVRDANLTKQRCKIDYDGCVNDCG
jgi:hypothetical protein